MNCKFILILILMSVTCAAVTAQNKMTLLSGKEIVISAYKVGDYKIEYDLQKKDKILKRKINKFRVFEISNEEGSGQILYQQDSLDEYSMTVQEVRDYVDGEKFALKTYRKDMNSAGAFAAGAGGGLLSFYGMPVPVIYGLVVERFGPAVPLPGKNLPANATTDAFEVGYQQKVRAMKLKQNLLSGSIGFAVGITVFSLWLGNVKF